MHFACTLSHRRRIRAPFVTHFGVCFGYHARRLRWRNRVSSRFGSGVPSVRKKSPFRPAAANRWRSLIAQQRRKGAHAINAIASTPRICSLSTRNISTFPSAFLCICLHIFRARDITPVAWGSHEPSIRHLDACRAQQGFRTPTNSVRGICRERFSRGDRETRRFPPPAQPVRLHRSAPKVGSSPGAAGISNACEFRQVTQHSSLKCSRYLCVFRFMTGLSQMG
jgi:hypothetical protein